jgi:hypothetical protein
MGTRSHTNWNLDDQGEYPRQLGWKLSRNGALVQHKFRLGNDLDDAKRREQRIKELWERVETTTKIKPAMWPSFALDVAKELARGKTQIEIPRGLDESAEKYARRVHQLQRDWPTLSLVAEDANAYVEGASTNRSRVEQQLAEIESLQLELGNLTEKEIATTKSGSLHEAMRAYIAWIKEDYYRPELGRITGNGRTKIRQTEILMRRHADVPLSSLDEEAVEEMFRFWRRRPTKLGSKTPITKKSAENFIGELKRFLRWLHKAKQFNWRKPENFAEIKTRVDPDPQERQKRLIQVETYTLDELIILNKYATPLERLLLLLGINCGFGAAEIGSLLMEEIVLFTAHDSRHQEILRYNTTDADSFIKRVRRKNGVYGEFLLFPQTVQGIQWAMQRRGRHAELASHRPLLVNERGEAYDKPTKSENRNQQIPNRFADLLRRIRVDHPNFRRLSFGKLRKTAGDTIRHFSDGEIFGVFMTHGQPVVTDDLADVYSNRPFGKVFDAIKKVQEYLAPMFAAAGEKPFVAQPQAYTSRKKRDKILELRSEGKSVREIADVVKKSRSTVHRYLARMLAEGNGHFAETE